MMKNESVMEVFSYVSEICLKTKRIEGQQQQKLQNYVTKIVGEFETSKLFQAIILYLTSYMQCAIHLGYTTGA